MRTGNRWRARSRSTRRSSAASSSGSAAAASSTILSDGYRGYTGEHGVIASGYVHLPRTQESFRLAGTEDVVPHAHRAISNLKAWLLGTHRGVGADHLQVYLDEFVFR